MLLRNREPRLRMILLSGLRAVRVVTRALFSYRVFIVIFPLLLIADNILYRVLGADYERNSPLLSNLSSTVTIYFFIIAGRFLLPILFKIKSLIVLLFFFCVATALFNFNPPPAGKIFYKQSLVNFIEIFDSVLALGVAFQFSRRLLSINNSKIVMPDNTFRTGEIIMADKNSDLAVIKIDRVLSGLAWGNPDGLTPAEEILALGFPLGGELAGEASVSKGSLSGVRRSRDVGVDYLQVDLTLNPGISGGPMVNICGEVVGINTAGLSGLGMGISMNSVKQKWMEMAAAKDSLQDIQRIEFNPEKSPLEAVRAFYNYLKARKLEKAFELLSENFKGGFGFDHWKQGYEPLLDTTVIKIGDDPLVADRVIVKLATKDLIDGEIVYQYFEGYWDVRTVEGKLRLWMASIKKVDEPGFMWYYE